MSELLVSAGLNPDAAGKADGDKAAAEGSGDKPAEGGKASGASGDRNLEQILQKKNDTITELHGSIQAMKEKTRRVTEFYLKKMAAYGVPPDELGFKPAALPTVKPGAQAG